MTSDPTSEPTSNPTSEPTPDPAAPPTSASSGPTTVPLPGSLPRPKPSLAERLAERPAGRGLAYRLANRVERARVLRRVPATIAKRAGTRLERRNGRLMFVETVPGISGSLAAEHNSDLVLDLCAAHSIATFVVPEPGSRRVRLGIVADHWERFLAALLDYGRTHPLYVGIAVIEPNGRPGRWAELSVDGRVRQSIAVQTQLEVFEPLRHPKGSQFFERNWACLVDRWDRDETGSLDAQVPNDRATHVGTQFQTPVEVSVGSRPAVTLSAFTPRHIYAIDYPIDLVYMWVDGADPRWVERKNRVLDSLGLPLVSQAVADARFREIGELRYSLRSVEEYAPWARTVYLVTDQQVPSWLNRDHPRLRVIDHTELFGDAGALPSFNSHAIGARLHHIEGLSEQYIHFNDDCFLGRSVLPEVFFQSNGVSKFFMSRATLDLSDPGRAPEHENARRNVINLLGRDFDRVPTRAFFHTPIAQRRSTMFELEERYREQFETTWRNQFRSDSDYEVNSWLHHYYGYLIGAAMPAPISYGYFRLSEATAAQRMADLLVQRNRDVFCLNDDPDTTADQHRHAAKWLARYFPTPCSFEK